MPSLPESISQSTLSFGTWTRRRLTIASSATDSIGLTFPDLLGPAVNRAHVYLPATDLPVNIRPDCGTPLVSRNSFTQSLEFVSFDVGVEPGSVALAREAGVFTLQSYNLAARGSVTFAPSAFYAAEVAGTGLRLTAVQQLQLALANVSASYVTAARAAFPDIDPLTIVASATIGHLSADDLTRVKQHSSLTTSEDLRQFIRGQR
jgi:hypothetical protein